MRIGRTLPPAAAPIYIRDIVSGLNGLFRGKQELERFKLELKEYFGVGHCFLVSSGKAALTLILRALKDMYPQRDEVLIPAFTCYSVPSAIARAGLKVRLCDINPDTLDFDFEQLAMSLERSADGLLAIISAHLFGLPANVEGLREMVDDPDVVIIEDAAQTMGAEWRGKKLGTLGDVGFFSLGRGKALSTVEGAIILTDRSDISEKIRIQMEEVPHYSISGLLALFFNGIALSLFMHPFLFWLPKSLPFLKLGDTIYNPHFRIRQMSAFQAGLANGWQEKVKNFKEIRAENSRQWSKLIQSLPNPQLSAKSYELEVAQPPSLIRFPIRIDDERLRQRLLKSSDRMGLGIMFTYPNSIDGIQELKADFNRQNFPAAKIIAHQLITLPIHPFVSEKDKVQIAALVSQMAN
jgi:dTDP-4-amino-4,6-dideoxygalactose transaminase